LSAGNPLRLRENHSGKFVAIRGFFFYLFKNFAALREKKNVPATLITGTQNNSH